LLFLALAPQSYNVASSRQSNWWENFTREAGEQAEVNKIKELLLNDRKEKTIHYREGIKNVK